MHLHQHRLLLGRADDHSMSLRAAGFRCRAGQEEQTPSSAASTQSWCVGPAVPRSRYVDPPTPLREPEQAALPSSPGALDGFRRGVARTLAAAPQCIMAGAIVAAGAAGFLKVRRASIMRRNCRNMWKGFGRRQDHGHARSRGGSKHHRGRWKSLAHFQLRQRAYRNTLYQSTHMSVWAQYQ